MAVRIEIDKDSGFCPGVVSAIRKAEEELDKSGKLFCLGDIVHNSKEVERLKQKGLVTITHDELRRLHDVKVLLRAHGEPPETYRIAKANGIEIIDATCPVVLKLQQRIKKSYSAAGRPQIVIYGKLGHAEVNGLVGQTDGNAIVVEGVEGVENIDFSREVARRAAANRGRDTSSPTASVVRMPRHDMPPGSQPNAADTAFRHRARVGAIRQRPQEQQRHDTLQRVRISQPEHTHHLQRRRYPTRMARRHIDHRHLRRNVNSIMANEQCQEKNFRYPCR